MLKTSNQLKAGAIISYVQILLHIVVLFVSTPILMKGLGKDGYGLYNTIYSTVSMLTILSLGIGQGFPVLGLIIV